MKQLLLTNFLFLHNILNEITIKIKFCLTNLYKICRLNESIKIKIADLIKYKFRSLSNQLEVFQLLLHKKQNKTSLLGW